MKVTGEAPSTSMAVPPCAPAASCSADEPPDPAHERASESVCVCAGESVCARESHATTSPPSPSLSLSFSFRFALAQIFTVRQADVFFYDAKGQLHYFAGAKGG
jgi:hypothetical protein